MSNVSLGAITFPPTPQIPNPNVTQHRPDLSSCARFSPSALITISRRFRSAAACLSIASVMVLSGRTSVISYRFTCVCGRGGEAVMCVFMYVRVGIPLASQTNIKIHAHGDLPTSMPQAVQASWMAFRIISLSRERACRISSNSSSVVVVAVWAVVNG